MSEPAVFFAEKAKQRESEVAKIKSELTAITKSNKQLDQQISSSYHEYQELRKNMPPDLEDDVAAAQKALEDTKQKLDKIRADLADAVEYRNTLKAESDKRQEAAVEGMLSQLVAHAERYSALAALRASLMAATDNEEMKRRIEAITLDHPEAAAKIEREARAFAETFRPEAYQQLAASSTDQDHQ